MARALEAAAKRVHWGGPKTEGASHISAVPVYSGVCLLLHQQPKPHQKFPSKESSPTLAHDFYRKAKSRPFESVCVFLGERPFWKSLRPSNSSIMSQETGLWSVRRPREVCRAAINEYHKETMLTDTMRRLLGISTTTRQYPNRHQR